jgi:hypothetical protein
MVTTMTKTAQRPARAADVHLTDNRFPVIAPQMAVRGITLPVVGIRMWGEVCFLPVYRTSAVSRSVAKGPPV